MKLQPPDFEWVAQVSLLRPAVPTGKLALILEQQDEQFHGMQTMDAGVSSRVPASCTERPEQAGAARRRRRIEKGPILINPEG
jgi:hypothetical protein